MKTLFHFLSYNAVFFMLSLIACAAAHKPATKSPVSYEIAGKHYHVLDSAHGFVEEGLASWYGDDFHGRPTASGETYDMYAKTAAHKTLPLGTRLRVSNLNNGQNAIVRVNDRGPFVRGRIIDVSYSVADELGIVETGVAPVKIEALALKTLDKYDFTHGNFTIQVGAFKHKENAQNLAARLRESHIALYESPGGIFYRVRLGHFSNLEEAQRACQELTAHEFSEAFVVAE